MRYRIFLATLFALVSTSSAIIADSSSIDVIELSSKEIAEAYAEGSFTATELTQAFLNRITEYEDVYNAFISFNSNALSRAAELDAIYATSGPVGPLHGVPIVIKDNIDQVGVPTTAGYFGFSSTTGGIDIIPSRSSSVVERLEQAGAIILGKTNMPDFAFDGTRSRSTVAGVTRNGYNIDKAPGGSSGGTATAVNLSFGVLGLGTETGGSIENPASAQALVGFKPTYGLVPLDGVVPIDATYRDVVGPLAKTVHDAAVTMDVIGGPTFLDLNTFAAAPFIPSGGFVGALSENSLVGKRFGLVGPGWRDTFLPLAPETEAFYQQAIADLEAQGATVVADPFLGSGFVELYSERPGIPGLISNGFQKYLNNLGSAAPFATALEFEALTGIDLPGTTFTTPPVEPTGTLAGDAYQAWRQDLRNLFSEVLDTFDLDGLFFPQAGSPIPNLVEDPSRPNFSPNNFPELPSNVINDLGVPVVTLPYGYYDDDTPMTLAFIGNLWDDWDIMSYAYDLEQATMNRVAPVAVPELSSPLLLLAVGLPAFLFIRILNHKKTKATC